MGRARSAARMAAALRFGTVWVNCHYQFANEMPHGGFGDSGIGRDLSIHALEAYREPKHVMVAHAG